MTQFNVDINGHTCCANILEKDNKAPIHCVVLLLCSS